MNQKDGRERKHRRYLIEVAVASWSRTTRKSIEDCAISATPGSPMLAFLQAVTEPAFAVTGEAIGEERLKQIVADIRKEHSVTNQPEIQAFAF